MTKRKTNAGQDLETLMTEIAHRYYIKKETQETIGSALNLPRMKINRLLKQAQEDGIVEIRIRLGTAQTQFVEQQMLDKFKLKRVLIAPDSANPEQQRNSVASLVSGYLEANLREGSVVAVGMGRNIAAVANANISRTLQSTIFVCATGGASEAGETGNADHICRKLAQSFGGTAQTLYAPAYVPDPALRRALLDNDTVRRSFRQALHADYVLVGIGDLGVDSHMVRVGWFGSDEIAKAQKKGVVGDLMGYDFFDLNGKPMNEELGGRVIGLSIDQLRQINTVIAVASEASKVQATFGALKTRSIDILATSLSNCQTLLSMET